ncbi:MAG: DNA primase, partial [Propionibacteriaceae bacterium]|nr:DNA primase [Propionibacteriaceae bacterium]
MFNPDDLEAVRERTRIEDVIGAHVTLRRAGGGTLVGLCPFHDEKTPSFNVTPSRGLYYCFGCGEGGDVIKFVQRINNESFVEAVEFLAGRLGLELRQLDDGRKTAEPGLRNAVLEANRLAAEFYSAQLETPDAEAGRRLLKERGFDREAATRFGVGYAPRDGHALRDLLKQRRVRPDIAVKAGLIRENGEWDVFQGRLVWPIRDAGHSVLGFGGRKLYDDDRVAAKYVNTSETVVYKKSSVLYGLDLARVNIARKSQAVVVEGYTDVMACHLAGVDTAVASCGTAFGEDHARLVQRLLGASDVGAGEVVFTFDGDAAGQAAAMKVFKLDSAFTTQTYVAVEPGGLDPCELRMAQGDAALRELIGRRVPLYEFVARNTVARFDLDRVDGRIDALRAAAPILESVRDKSKADGYLQQLAKWVGVDVADARREVKIARARRPEQPAPFASSQPSAWSGGASGRGAARPSAGGQRLDGSGGGQGAAPAQGDLLAEAAQTGQDALVAAPAYLLPNPRDPRLEPERGALRLALQAPQTFTDDWNEVAPSDFSNAAYAALWELVTRPVGRAADEATGAATAQLARPELAPADPDPTGQGGPPDPAKPSSQPDRASPRWAQSVLERADDPGLQSLIEALAVEPLAREASESYTDEYATEVRLRR